MAASMHGLERYPSTKREGRLDGHAVERDGEISAREAIAVYIVCHGTLAAERRIDLFSQFTC